jgi:hypothetical protein
MIKLIWKKMISLIVCVAVILSVGVFSVAQALGSLQNAMVQQSYSNSSTLISTAETTWRYFDSGEKPDDTWKSDIEFKDSGDSGWKSGTGSFGAKNGAIADLGNNCTPNTLLNQYINGTGGDDIPVFYFRSEFDLSDISAVKSLTGSVTYDDAAIIYVNGQKIAGFDDASFDSNGYGGSNSGDPKTGEISFTDISKLNLKNTGNLVAVEIHQGRSNSSDIYFDMKELGFSTEPSETPGAEISNVSFEIGADETQRNIVWYSSSAAAGQAQYAVKPSGWKEGDDFPTESVKSFDSEQEDSRITGLKTNKTTMTGLQANTSYLYRVGNSEKWSSTYSFTTNDFGSNVDFNFLFAGDPQIGAGGNISNDSSGWNNTLTRAFGKFSNASFLLSAGDQINDKNDTEETEYSSFLSPSVLKQIPLATNVGNHDTGSIGYTQHYNMPNVSGRGVSDSTGDGSGDYWFIYNNVLFMSLNSNNLSTADHTAFMQEAIAQQGDNVRWKVVTFHHSVFSVADHSTDSDILQRRNELPSKFTELGIDVVLMGHDHHYTRTYMMNGTTPVVPEGHDVSQGEVPASSVSDPAKGQVLYLTANSASGSKYYPLNSAALLNFVAVRDQQNRQNITNIEVTDNSLKVTTYYADTDAMPILDTFTINRTPADTGKPVISLPDSEHDTVALNSAFNPMQGVTATDNVDGDVTNKIYVAGSVDTTKAGDYEITYTVTDTVGNTAVIKRTVTVKSDTKAPVITLPDNNEAVLNDTFDPMAGVSAMDDIDGDATDRIFVNGGVNTGKAGQYTLIYYVTDRSGNKAQAERTITVSGPANSGGSSSSHGSGSGGSGGSGSDTPSTVSSSGTSSTIVSSSPSSATSSTVESSKPLNGTSSTPAPAAPSNGASLHAASSNSTNGTVPEATASESSDGASPNTSSTNSAAGSQLDPTALAKITIGSDTAQNANVSLDNLKNLAETENVKVQLKGVSMNIPVWCLNQLLSKNSAESVTITATQLGSHNISGSMESPAGIVFTMTDKNGKTFSVDDFGSDILVTWIVPAADTEKIKLETAHLYHVADDGTTKQVPADFSMNSDGTLSVVFKTTHFSSYSIISEAASSNLPASSSSSATSQTDHNGASGGALPVVAVLVLLAAAIVAFVVYKRRSK